ncbi:MAG TPA: acylneuraminate cytidylyltransferase family protein [Armatimonadota bacterium]
MDNDSHKRKLGEVLAILPARGGSKGIPRKNVREIAGKPLIVWTIEAAQQAELVDRLVVSTDDAEIAAVAAAAGAEVINRPAELAQDATHTEPVLIHALQHLREQEGYQPEIVVLLQCTSPLRGAEIIDQGLRMLAATGCDCVLGVAPIQNPHLQGRIGEQSRWQPEYEYGGRKFSQQAEEKYTENGALYVLRRTVLEQYGNRLGGDVRALVMDPLLSVDIDLPEDLETAGRLLPLFRSH